MPQELARIEPQLPVLPEGRELSTVAAMAASAKAVMATPRPRSEIIKAIQETAAMMGAQIDKAGRNPAFYELPFKIKGGGTTNISGLTTGLAEYVAQEHGNCLVAATVERETEDAYYLQGVFVNVRTGFMLTRPFRQPKHDPGTDSAFAKDPERGLQVTLAKGASKATRNVIVNALAFECKVAIEAARAANAKVKRGRRGETASREEWKALYARASKFGVTRDQVLAYLGKDFKAWKWTEYDALSDALNGIESGDIPLSEVFGNGAAVEEPILEPPPGAPETREPGSDDAPVTDLAGGAQ